jgi:hypothetical protein
MYPKKLVREVMMQHKYIESFFQLFYPIWQEKYKNANQPDESNQEDWMEESCSDQEGQLVLLAKYEQDSSSELEDNDGDIKMFDNSPPTPAEKFVFCKELDDNLEYLYRLFVKSLCCKMLWSMLKAKNWNCDKVALRQKLKVYSSLSEEKRKGRKGRKDKRKHQ